MSCGDDNTIRVWGTKSGRLLTVLRGHNAAVRQAEFTEDGTTLVSVDESGVCRFWRTR